MRSVSLAATNLALFVAYAPALAYAPNGPEFVSMGQCNSYLKRWADASRRGQNWEEVERFEAAYCVATDWGTYVAVFPD